MDRLIIRSKSKTGVPTFNQTKKLRHSAPINLNFNHDENRKKYYSKEYKLEAVALAEQRDNVSSIVLELGIRHDMLRRWKKEYSQNQSKAFIGGGNAKKKNEPNELSILRKKLREVELERDILKKAVGIFSKNDQLDTDL